MPDHADHADLAAPAARGHQYLERTSLFAHYALKRAAIVMAGDSLVARADWNELLGRTDVANRGIGSDTTHGLRARLDAILSLQPRVVFVMSGRNDVGAGRGGAAIAADLGAIVSALRQGGAQAVLHTIVPVGQRPNAQQRNAAIREINAMIADLATAQGCGLIDLTPRLAGGGHLDGQFTADGSHLMGSAYAIWRDEILSVLRAVGA